MTSSEVCSSLFPTYNSVNGKHRKGVFSNEPSFVIIIFAGSQISIFFINVAKNRPEVLSVFCFFFPARGLKIRVSGFCQSVGIYPRGRIRDTNGLLINFFIVCYSGGTDPSYSFYPVGWMNEWTNEWWMKWKLDMKGGIFFATWELHNEDDANNEVRK